MSGARRLSDLRASQGVAGNGTGHAELLGERRERADRKGASGPETRAVCGEDDFPKRIESGKRRAEGLCASESGTEREPTSMLRGGEEGRRHTGVPEA